ncbi:MAG: MBL fold metallo-hydrolase [Lentisphaerae bacterium]|nr:MBL fold metallo-hydrolase [Lentisphaerota bacterium]
MNVTFLGTGTSVGIPAIGCQCPVCQSTDPRNNRRRTSLYVQAGGTHLVIDTPPDFREQMLTYRVPRIDAVLFTHAHADHIFGFDDIRRFNAMQDAVIPAYGSASTIADLRRIYNYVESEQDPGVYRPQIDFRTIDRRVQVGGAVVEALPVEHGSKPTHGYVVRAGGVGIGYFPDCHRLEDSVVSQLAGLDVMILDGLRHRPHSTHLTVAESVAYLTRIGARQSYLTHMCHDLDHAATEASLPGGIRVAYDGLVLDV